MFFDETSEGEEEGREVREDEDEEGVDGDEKERKLGCWAILARSRLFSSSDERVTMECEPIFISHAGVPSFPFPPSLLRRGFRGLLTP